MSGTTVSFAGNWFLAGTSRFSNAIPGIPAIASAIGCCLTQVDTQITIANLAEIIYRSDTRAGPLSCRRVTSPCSCWLCTRLYGGESWTLWRPQRDGRTHEPRGVRRETLVERHNGASGAGP